MYRFLMFCRYKKSFTHVSAVHQNCLKNTSIFFDGYRIVLRHLCKIRQLFQFFITDKSLAFFSCWSSINFKSEWYKALICEKNSTYRLGIKISELYLATLHSCGVQNVSLCCLVARRGVLFFFNNFETWIMNAWYDSRKCLAARLNEIH